MQLTFENESDIPSGDVQDFVPFEQDGKNIFMHKDLAESKKLAYRHQGQLSKLTTDFDGFKTKIETDRDAATAAALKDKNDAIAAKIAELKGNGDHSELHKMELQQLEDKILSISTENDGLKTQYGELQTNMVEKENLTLATSIASQYVAPELIGSFSKLLMMGHIKNVDGKSVFTNASGDAVDNDIARIIEVINNDPDLKHYAKFPGSKGGFGGKGGSAAVDGKTISRKAFEALSPHEKSTKMRAGIQIIS